jgi:hypothetical protein
LIILPLTYAGPVQLFSKFLLKGEKCIEQYDNYNKQSYRNRCVILSANGPIPLIIPVKKEKNRKCRVKDIVIDYDTRWQKLHWRGILAGYSSSPFFEYYRDPFEPFYTKHYHFLVDYCFDINSTMLDLLDIDEKMLMTEEYLFEGDERITYDFRDVIHPKRELEADPLFSPVPYQQVFSEKYGFVPNLSILDLLFNAGPESKSYLRKSANL